MLVSSTTFCQHFAKCCNIFQKCWIFFEKNQVGAVEGGRPWASARGRGGGSALEVGGVDGGGLGLLLLDCC
jgi:hypothetical protein